MQTDDQDNLKINLTDKEDKQVFESIWQSPNMEDMRVIDLPRMDSKTLHDCLAYYSIKYYNSYTSEVQKMVEIVDPKDTIKNKEDGEKWRKLYTDRW